MLHRRLVTLVLLWWLLLLLLLLLKMILHVFGWHLRVYTAVLLLQEWIEVVLVVLVGRGEKRTGRLSLMPLLHPLETKVVLLR